MNEKKTPWIMGYKWEAQSPPPKYYCVYFLPIDYINSNIGYTMKSLINLLK